GGGRGRGWAGWGGGGGGAPNAGALRYELSRVPGSAMAFQFRPSSRVGNSRPTSEPMMMAGESFGFRKAVLTANRRTRLFHCGSFGTWNRPFVRLIGVLPLSEIWKKSVGNWPSNWRSSARRRM